jgi:glutamate racemase
MSNFNFQPIGVFDSGFGGVSILLESMRILPYEDYIYVADSANCPYGNKSQDEIVFLTENITEFLLENNVKMIVVACNTATTAAIKHLRAKYSIPFVGVEPAVKPASRMSKSGVIGVLATEGTINSDFYNTTKSRFASDIKVISIAGDGLVEAVEKSMMDNPATIKLLEKYILPMIDGGADQLVLGCTHFPFLIEQIKRVSSGKLNVINPAPSVARRVKDVLDSFNFDIKQTNGKVEFYTSGSPAALHDFLFSISGIKYDVKRYEYGKVSSTGS